MDRRRLTGCYARLIGIRDSLPTRGHNVAGSIGEDYDSIISELDTVLEDDDMLPFKVEHAGLFGEEGQLYCRLDVLLSKVKQAISFLDQVYFAEDKIIE